MDSILILIGIGLLIGTIGTLIGAGGGFLLVPLLLLTHPQMPPHIVTAISIAIVGVNAISGSLAYAYAERINYRAGLLFAAFTIPGSIIGVYLIRYIPRDVFNMAFGLLLVTLAVYLFIKNRNSARNTYRKQKTGPGWKRHLLTDRRGVLFSYHYHPVRGSVVSAFIGFLSPVLGIGGGIIHVPVMVQWLQFPVHIATATSQFILAIMSVISVATHAFQGSYADAETLRLIGALSIGVIPGAQIGARLSRLLPTVAIIRVLAVCLAAVGIRILMGSLG